MDQDMLVFAGSASPALTAGICDHLSISVARSEVKRFSDGNLFVRVLENVRGRSTYIVQSTAFPVNDNFMELLFWVDALKRASAESVTVVMPFFSYAKGDKKDEPRVSIRARVCADAIEAAGADRVVTVDLHAAQIQGFFKIPVDDLYAAPVLCEAIAEEYDPSDLVVVAPDTGFAKKARQFSSRLKTPLAIVDKERKGHDEVAEAVELIGDVRGRVALLVDDFTTSGSTLASAASLLLDRGASRVAAAITHGVFGPGSRSTIDASPLERVFATDTVESHQDELSGRARIVSIAPLLGEAIHRVHNRESVSVLFD